MTWQQGWKYVKKHDFWNNYICICKQWAGGCFRCFLQCTVSQHAKHWHAYALQQLLPRASLSKYTFKNNNNNKKTCSIKSQVCWSNVHQCIQNIHTTVRSYTTSTSHHRMLTIQGKETHLSNNVSVVMSLWSQYRSRTINTFADLKASPLLRPCGWPSTWLNSLHQPHCQHNFRLAPITKGRRERMWERLRMHTSGRGGGAGLILSQRSSNHIEALKRAFEDLHFASSLQCAEHWANLFKGKQITPEVKEHGGILVKTFYVSLNHSLSSPFEDRFYYNNIHNQSLNSLSSRSSLLPVGWVEMT